jgi:hypothetical protein
MRELDVTGLPEDDDLRDSAEQALAGDTTYLVRDGVRIAAIVPVFVAEEHDEDIDAAVTSAIGAVSADEAFPA